MGEERIAVASTAISIYLRGTDWRSFSFRQLMNRKPADLEDRGRQLALLSGYAGGVSLARYSVFWSGHIIDEVRKHLRNDSFWSIGEAQDTSTRYRPSSSITAGDVPLTGCGEVGADCPIMRIGWSTNRSSACY